MLETELLNHLFRVILATESIAGTVSMMTKNICYFLVLF